MGKLAVVFDLDDTLLWDERSVEEAFEATCRTAAEHTGVNASELLASVREEARALYESYDTYAFTKMIGINPFEGLWANFTAGEQPEFRQLQQLAPVYRKESWRRGCCAAGSMTRHWQLPWRTSSALSVEHALMYMRRPMKC